MNQIVRERVAATRSRIERACRDAGRAPETVRLLAVSKKHPATAVRALAAEGQRAFGESYADEGTAKIAEVADSSLEWHFVGPIQSNKTRMIAENFDWVHSIDRAKIVRRLNDQRPEKLGPLQVLIQVNVDDERQKAGCRPGEVEALAERIAGRERLALRGLMAIPSPREDFDAQRQGFEPLARLFERLCAAHPGVDTLSAGMSADLEAAITAGATMVRIGTALFGPRE